MNTGRFRSFAFLILIPFLLNCSGGGGSSDISTVKNGTLGLDTSVTVGNAFEGYKLFTKKEWKALSDPQKRRIVEFSGTLDMPAILKKYKDLSAQGGNLGQHFQKEYENIQKVANKANECAYFAQFYIAQDGKSFSLNKSGIRYALKDGKRHEGTFQDYELNLVMPGIYKNDGNVFGQDIYTKSPYF